MIPVPDPVLGVLAAVGLLMYVGLGSITGAITARMSGWRYRDGKWTIYQKNENGNGGYWATPRGTPWDWVGWLILLWPAWLCLLVAGAAIAGVGFSIFGIGYFPFKISRSAIIYLAQIGD